MSTPVGCPEGYHEVDILDPGPCGCGHSESVPHCSMKCFLVGLILAFVLVKL